MRKPVIDPKSETLSTYLKIDNGQLKIPFSQRPYEWERAEVERLFDDLTSLFLSEEIHMLNFLTLSSENPDEIRIYDGQQRTITSILILAVFTHKLQELKLDKEASYMERTYLQEDNPLNSEDPIKRKLKFDNREDQKVFYELLDNGLENMDKLPLNRPSQVSFVDNYKLISQLLEEFIIEESIESEDISKVLNDMLDQTMLITIKTDSDALAREMFESLNNTGKALENYFVLKNDIVICLSEKKVKDRWTRMDSNIKDYNPRNFLTAFATLLVGKTTTGRALDSIYAVYDKEKQEDMDHLLDLMVTASDYYDQILTPADISAENLESENENYIRLSNNISIFNVKQHHHLILAMFMSGKELSEINTVLGYILNIAVRNFYFQEAKGNTIEVPLANLARDIYRNNISMDEIIKKLDALLVNDKDLVKIIQAKNISTPAEKRRMKFILKEMYQFNDFRKELQIKDSLKEIHYEHILPQNPSEDSQWRKDFSAIELKHYTTKVGNATLLLDKINHSASNRDFIDKKAYLLDSDIPDNGKVAANEQWTSVEIDRRTDELAEKIIEYLNSLLK